MEFIDHTGHIFSLTEYSSYPIGYEYSENPYIFWISDEYTSQLSIDCFYIKPIYLLSDEKIDSINIKIENSKYFYLLSPSKIREKLNEIENEYKTNNRLDWSKTNIELKFFTENVNKEDKEENDFSKEINDICIENDVVKIKHNKFYYLNNKGENIPVNESIVYSEKSESFNIEENNNNEFIDGIFYEDDGINYYANIDGKKQLLKIEPTEYYLLPFYVLANVDTEGVWMTNILIELNNRFCPITVGGTFVDEQEALIINGKNMGIDLPKDICRAFYNTSFWNETPNMSMWNQKIKEYLLNYMKLKGERGNFQSAIKALKWFGYGDRLKLYSLVQTDNNLANQYILDNFDLDFDVINEFRYFRCSTLMSISLPGIIENKNESNKFDFNNDFWGEGKPKLIDVFNENLDPKHYDEGDIDFLRPYYDWTFNEIGLKLCALKYYYKKYFLPLHLSIHRASITNQVFANDIKMLNIASNIITEESIYVHDYNINVKFPQSKVIFYQDVTGDNIVVDPTSWICDNNIDHENSTEQYYRITDNCFVINIDFINQIYEKSSDYIFNCKMFFYKNDKVFIESSFVLYSTKESYNIKLVIFPKYWNKNFNMNFWTDDKYSIRLLVNNNWYEYSFELKIPELDIEIGKLEYVYDYKVFKQFNSVKSNGVPIFNAFMWLPDTVQVNNINFVNELIRYTKDQEFSLDNNIKKDLLYYYYINENGNKEWLSTGHSTIEERKDGMYIVPNDNSVEGKIDIIEKGPHTQIYSSISRNIESYLDIYSTKVNVPINPYLMNKVYIFNLYERNGSTYKNIEYIKSKYSSDKDYSKFEIKYEDYEYGDNDNEAVAKLYEYIFDKNGNWYTTELDYFINSEWKKDDILKNNFDIYLMHDFQMWYIILISKQTIGNSLIDLDIKNKTLWRIGRNGKYLFMEHNRSDEKFLINRMNFSKMNGVYHFNSRDMIAARLLNLKNIASKLIIGSRWSFTPMTFGTVYNRYFNSPSNIGLMSCAEDEFKLNKGYYQVSVKYSVDNFINEYEPRSTKILIDNDITPVSYVKNEIQIVEKEENTDDVQTPEIKIKKDPQIHYRLVNDNFDILKDFNLEGLVFDNVMVPYGYKPLTTNQRLLITIDNAIDDEEYNIEYYIKTGKEVITCSNVISKNKLFVFTLNTSNHTINQEIHYNDYNIQDGVTYKLNFRILENETFNSSEEYYVSITQFNK